MTRQQILRYAKRVLLYLKCRQPATIFLLAKVSNYFNSTKRSGETANSYFEVLGVKATRIKLTEVNGDAVEEEVSIAGSIVDSDKALEVLVERFC